jgi:dCMP deaminase
MILGLTGKNASGKGEVVRLLTERSFRAHSLSDEVRQELAGTGTPTSRENLIAWGRELRRHFGPGVLAERVLPRLDLSSHHVVDSIRHPAEVLVLRRQPGFFLLGLTGSPELRFQRLRERARPGDPRTFEEFLAFEAREEGTPAGAEEPAQQLDRCLEMADRRLANEGTLEELQEQVLGYVQECLAREKRPSWDRYFLDIALVVARRSNCLKRRVAAVIVKDLRIISTGYNGTPRGTRNCNEGGCPRCAELAPGGTRLGECVCSHAEENAIVQAAYHGVSVKGSALYSTYSPCLICAKMIINAGIREVVYRHAYPLGADADALLREAGVELRQLPEDV